MQEVGDAPQKWLKTKPQTVCHSNKAGFTVCDWPLSGRKDLNLRPLAPHASALAGLRHAPNNVDYYSRKFYFMQ
jgi:hypothetical protein